MASPSCAVMVASPIATRRRLPVFPLARCPALPGLAAPAPRSRHVVLRTRPLARRLRLLRLTLRGPRLVDRRGGDALRGLLGPSTHFQILLDVVVLALALRAPSFLWHPYTSGASSGSAPSTVASGVRARARIAPDRERAGRRCGRR